MISDKCVVSISQKIGFEKSQIERLWQAFVVNIYDCLVEYQCVKFLDLGEFCLDVVEQKIEIDSITQKKTLFPPHAIVSFVCSGESLGYSRDFLRRLSASSGESEDDVLNFVDALSRVVSLEIESSEDFEIVEFGVFSKESGKIDFSPGHTMLVEANRELAHLKPVSLSEDMVYMAQMDILSRQAKELKSIIADIQGNSNTKEEVVEAENGDSGDSVSSSVIEDNVPLSKPIVKESNVSLNIEEEERNTEKSEVIEKDENGDLATDVRDINSQPSKEEKPRNGWKIVAILALLILVGVVAFVLGTGFGKSISRDVVVDDRQPVLLIDSVEVDTVNVEKEPLEIAPEPVVFEHRYYSEFVDTAIVRPGSTLVHFSLKYYGSKAFWIYIYEANRDVLPSADGLVIGTKIKIPKMDSVLINPQDTVLIAKIKAITKNF